MGTDVCAQDEPQLYACTLLTFQRIRTDTRKAYPEVQMQLFRSTGEYAWLAPLHRYPLIYAPYTLSCGKTTSANQQTQVIASGVPARSKWLGRELPNSYAESTTDSFSVCTAKPYRTAHVFPMGAKPFIAR